MKTIRIDFPDTPAMRELLGQLTGHCHDDVAPFFEGEAQNAKELGLGDGQVAKARASQEAAEAFTAIVTSRIYGVR